MSERLPRDVAGLMQRVDATTQRVKARLGRYWRVLPVLSLAWGVLSGWSLSRDYAHSQHLLVALGAFVLMSVVARVRAQRHSADAAKPDVAYGAATFAIRYVVQYVTAFCLPLLALAGAWATFGMTLLLAVLSFSGRLWRRLAALVWFPPLACSFTIVLATSYAFVVLLPERLALFYPVLGGIAVVAALPWGEMRTPPRVAGMPRRAWLPALLVGAVVLGQVLANAWIRFPPLALWLRRPAIGVDVQGRALVERWSPAVEASRFAAALDAGATICCLTPVVSPRGVLAPVIHEWLADGEVIDRIELPPVRGTHDEGEAAFRTYSCKKNLPRAAHGLECRAYLRVSEGVGADGRDLFLGRARVAFR